MERLMEFDQIRVTAEVKQPACQTCPFLYGEMQQVLHALKLLETSGEISASVSCASRSVKTKHIEISLNNKGQVISANNSIRNWQRREVHCSL